ncbi:MAG TPA: type II secretion system F family protein [Candidatus Adamsella sp.]|nr:type II secretion system F family protein [Candidatus Adamsella sp.]
MPSYEFSGLNKQQKMQRGVVNAESIQEAKAKVKKLGLVHISVREDRATAKAEKDASQVKIDTGINLPLKQKLDFILTLRTLVKTGVPIIEALIFMENNADNKKTRALSNNLRQLVLKGATFAEAANKFTACFDNISRGLIRAGEESGELDMTLDRLVELMKKQAALKKKVIGVMTYPAIVVTLAFLVVLVMLIVVFPSFKDLYANLGAELPVPTKICMGAGEFMKKNWHITLIGIIAFISAIISLFRWEVSKRIIDKYVLEIPVLSKFVQFVELSNFISVLLVVYEAGIPLVDCFYMGNLTIKNFTMNEAVNKATKLIQQGTQVSSAMKTTKVFPNMVLFMISTGEQSGNLEEMLRQIGEYIDNTLAEVIDLLTSLMEPLLMVVIGGLVLFLALALYLPMFQTYAHI